MPNLGAISLFIFLHCYATAVLAQECIPRSFGESSTVCVCNSTHCDAFPVRPQLSSDEAFMVYSSQAGDRFKPSVVKFEPNATKPEYGTLFTLDTSVEYQTITGFGGAMTDAASLNIFDLSDGAIRNLISSYFGPKGIEYSVIRIPMAGCDFSTREYSYNDHAGNLNMSKFALAEEDLQFKIPLIQKALSLSEKPVWIFGSPWSAPAWMKDNDSPKGLGSLKTDDASYKAWALYYLRFLEEYKKNGINISGVTAQNEPTDGNIPGFSFPCMGWTPNSQARFVGHYLGPTLEGSEFKDVKVMILDDQRILLPGWAEAVFEDPEALKYTAGVAVHWYMDMITKPSSLSHTHSLYPDKFIMSTEACHEHIPGIPTVQLGSWSRAQNYMHDIMEDLKNWVVGWTDWNMALDMEGGPNYVSNFVDSPVIVNGQADEFYKQPMFYALGHFSKMVPPGSKRVELTEDHAAYEAVAFVTPSGDKVVIIYNNQSRPATMHIKDPEKGFLNFDMDAHAFATITWK